MQNILIKNGLIIDPKNNLYIQQDLAIIDNKIQYQYPENTQFSKVIDANNKWVTPGIIDVCNRPQLKHPHGSTLEQEANQIVKRGILGMLIPPDADPIIDSVANAKQLINQASFPNPHIFLLGALSQRLKGEKIADLTLLNKYCVAFSNSYNNFKNLKLLINAYEYAASFNLPVVILANNQELSEGGLVHNGVIASKLGLKGIPHSAETIAVAVHLELIRQTGVKAHFTCLTCKQSVDFIARAKQEGFDITCDVSMQHLWLSEHAVDNFAANYYVLPPFRAKEDQRALLDGVKSGVIDAICSMHQPLDAQAKLAPFGETTPGMSTMDTFLSLGVKLVNEGKISLNQLIQATSNNPSDIFNLPIGHLTENSPANLTVIDPNQTWQVTKNSLLSHGKNSGFLAQQLPGIVEYAVIDGKLVYSHNSTD